MQAVGNPVVSSNLRFAQHNLQIHALRLTNIILYKIYILFYFINLIFSKYTIIIPNNKSIKIILYYIYCVRILPIQIAIQLYVMLPSC